MTCNFFQGVRMSTVVEETTPPVECSSRASPSPAISGPITSNVSDRNRNLDRAPNFIRERVTQQQQQQAESKLSEGGESTFGKSSFKLLDDDITFLSSFVTFTVSVFVYCYADERILDVCLCLCLHKLRTHRSFFSFFCNPRNILCQND